MKKLAPIVDRAGQTVTQAGYDALVAEVERLRSARGTRILRLPEVERRVGLCKTQLYELVAASRFPAPVKLTERAIGWVDSEIEAFIAEKMAARKEMMSENGAALRAWLRGSRTC